MRGARHAQRDHSDGPYGTWAPSRALPDGGCSADRGQDGASGVAVCLHYHQRPRQLRGVEHQLDQDEHALHRQHGWAGDALRDGQGQREGQSVIAVADPKPEKLAIYVVGTYAVELSGKGKVAGVVYAPSSTVTVGGDAEIRGAVVGNALNMSSTSDFFYDSTLRGQ